MSWASPAEEWGDFGGSGSDPPPLKMSVIAYFWQSLSCWLIWDRFQVVTSWAELAQLKSGGILGGLARTPHHSKCLSLLISDKVDHASSYFSYIFLAPPSAPTSRGPADVHFLAYLNMQIIADHIKICYLIS